MNNEIFFISLIAIIAMVFGYTFNLDKRTLKLEKKNGHEQHQIDELKKKIEILEAENRKLRQDLELFKSLLQKKYQSKHKAIKN